ncbi:MAG: NADH-quinone oxidoreductase subunit J [candidate division Zixibacteria bacterium]|nr:NADH-quinone oxidoreductase subunit J [candidate division Zixibacteria bacterium]
MELVIFVIMSIVATVCAILVISHRNPVASALFLIATMVSLAILFLALNAPFLAAIQIILYAGAIMVLFLFVIMLLNLRKDEFGPERRGAQRFFAILFGFLFLILVATAIDVGLSTLGYRGVPTERLAPAGVEPLAELLFTKYLFPFELASVLLLVAIVGAIVMAKRKL